ncbi:MAG TPA: hypothetical protein VJ964_10270, partial [Balneolaceae bacterium]|nr:hypothetical protein [Balneolaceae bacterium]
KLFQKYLAAGDTKTYPDQLKLYLKLVWFAGEVGTGAGDVAGDPGYPPTSQEKEVYDLISKRLDKANSEFNELMNQEVSAFNQWAEQQGIGLVIKQGSTVN